MEIILALWWIWLPLLIWWLIARNKPKSTPSPLQPSASDIAWQNYLLTFKNVVRTDAEKDLLDALLTRKTAEQLYPSLSGATVSQAQAQPATVAQSTPVSLASSLNQPISSYIQPKPVDNTMLLLYFGAFLLVASAGLFVALGTFSGLTRTVGVALTAALLYIAGLWLYRTKPKLAQAGVSFVGTAMMIAPLTGVAWYNLVSNQTHGAMIWFVTSVACLVLYVHALKAVNNAFMAYLLIGSFVSSIESSVLTVALPTYALAWAMIVASVIVQVAGSRFATNLAQASDVSARLLVPLSILGSLILLPDFGSRQFATTVLLAGGYYALMGWQRAGERVVYSAAAQLSIMVAVANYVYSFVPSFETVGLVLAGIGLAYAVVILAAPKVFTLVHSLSVMVVLVSGASMVLTVMDAWSLMATLTAGLIVATVIWLKLQSDAGFFAGGCLLLALPLVLGQYALNPHANASGQMLLCAVAAGILGALTLLFAGQARVKATYQLAAGLFLVGCTLLITTAWIVGFTALLVVSLVLSTFFMLLHVASKDHDWLVLAGLTTIVVTVNSAMVYGFDTWRFSFAVALGLAITTTLSLRSRDRIIRALVVGYILASPVALGAGGVGIHWSAGGFAGGYLLAMMACLIARAIARGKLFVSSRVAVSSYEKQASQVFVAGYSVAGLASVLISLFDPHSQLITTLVLAAITLIMIFIVYKVEADDAALVIVPFLLQAILFSGVRPDLSSTDAVGVMAVAASALGVSVYTLRAEIKLPKHARAHVSLAALIAAYAGPALVVTGVSLDKAMLLGFSLLLAGLITIYHNRNADQTTREVSVGVVILAVHWITYSAGVHNVHIHAHLLALFLAGFAAWRSRRGDSAVAHTYVQALFVVATLPLALQALAGEQGATYGLLLIVQQVSFMLIGVVLNQRFLLRAGMWVALAAVLYQLRGLGWAFLSLIAVVLIGVAIYRLQRHEAQSS